MLKKIIKNIKKRKDNKKEQKLVKDANNKYTEFVKLENSFNNGELDAKRINKYKVLKEEIEKMSSKFIMKDGKLILNPENAVSQSPNATITPEQKTVQQPQQQEPILSPEAGNERVSMPSQFIEPQTQEITQPQEKSTVYDKMKQDDEAFNKKVAEAKEKELRAQQRYMEQQQRLRQEQDFIAQQQYKEQQQAMFEQQQQAKMDQHNAMLQQQYQEEQLAKKRLQQKMIEEQQLQSQQVNNQEINKELEEDLNNEINVIISVQDMPEIRVPITQDQYEPFANALSKAMIEGLPISVPPYVFNGNKLIAYRPEKRE